MKRILLLLSLLFFVTFAQASPRVCTNLKELFAKTFPHLFSRNLNDRLVIDATADPSFRHLFGSLSRRYLSSREGAYRQALLRNPPNTPQGEAHRDFDVVIVGNGPHAAIVAANMTGKRILVLGDGTGFGTFDSMGKTFYINSGEAGENSPNTLPGGLVQVRHLLEKGEEFPPGRAIGDATLAQFVFSDAITLTSTAATALHRTSDGGFQVTTSIGVFNAKNVVVASGLGKRKFPFLDDNSRSIVAAEYNNKTYGVEFIDDYMSRSQQLIESSRDPSGAIAGKVGAYIGAGDGGAIGIEYGLGYGPPEGYGFRKLSSSQLPSKVFWYGQKSKNADEYKKSTWKRYHDLAAHFPGGSETKHAITPMDTKVTAIEKTADGRFRIFDSNGGSQVVDYIKVSAGYDTSGLTSFLSTLDYAGNGLKLGYLESQEGNAKVNVAKVPIVGSAIVDGVFIVGPATGGLDTPDAPGGVNSPRIEVLGPRTQKVASLIQDRLKTQPAKPETVFGEEVDLIISPTVGSRSTFALPISQSNLGLARNAEEAKILARIHIISSLANATVEGNGSVQVRVVKESETKAKIFINGLDDQDGRDLIELGDFQKNITPLLNTGMTVFGLNLSRHNESINVEFF